MPRNFKLGIGSSSVIFFCFFWWNVSKFCQVSRRQLRSKACCDNRTKTMPRGDCCDTVTVKPHTQRISQVEQEFDCSRPALAASQASQDDRVVHGRTCSLSSSGSWPDQGMGLLSPSASSGKDQSAWGDAIKGSLDGSTSRQWSIAVCNLLNPKP